MRRRAKPTKAKVEAKPPVSRKAPKTDEAQIRDLEKRLAEAIEREAQALKRESEALEQQTATGEILRAISDAQTDAQPVFDAIAESAVRLCEAARCSVWRPEGDLFRCVARCEMTPEGHVVSASTGSVLEADSLPGRVIRERKTLQVNDVPDNPAVPPKYQEMARSGGYRALMAVPMVHEGLTVGVIAVVRPTSTEFSARQIDLVKTFADQAVIAIENVRLFKELEARNRDLTEALDRQTATADVLRIIAQSPTDLQPVLDAIATSAVRLCAASDAVIERLEGDRFYNAAHAGTQMKGLVGLPLPLTRQFPGGRAVLDRKRIILDDIQLVAESEYPDTLELLKLNTVHSCAEIPLLSEGKPLGSLAVLRAEVRPFTDAEIALLETFASQAVIAIENVRLFHEIEDKSRQLEAASRHKSEFLANMSHELRTPLNAVIGFSEVLLQRMFGALTDKQDEYLKDIYASGQHLLSLINDILDLSKIEAGHMELAPAAFHLPSALDNAVTLVRGRADRHGIALQVEIDPQLGELVGDERKVKQVILNLLANAVKFTPEGGRISLTARRRDRVVEIAVTDTGVGIAPEDQAAIFEEFRQVGSDERKQEGTGLGLTLAKKFVELHGGRIWVESAVGRGATFTFTLPVK